MNTLGNLVTLLAGVATAATCSVASASSGVLLVSDNISHQIMALDLSDASGARPFTSGATLNYISDMILGPDGHLYVLDCSVGRINRVHRFNGWSGVLMSEFAQLGPEGLDGGITFGPDGHLYATCSWETVRKYDGTTGEFMGDVLSLIGTQLYCIASGPDDRLYLGGGDKVGFIARCSLDGTECELLSSGGDSNGPRSPVWDRNGDFYYADLNDGVVRRYDGQTGAVLGVFADPPSNGNVGLAFGADGHLYVSAVWDNAIYRHDGTNGAYLGTFATGVQAPTLISIPAPQITTQPKHQVAVEGGSVTFAVTAKSVACAGYQWSLGAAPIPGATNAYLTLATIGADDAGSYSVAVSNIGGVTDSEVVALSVLQPPRLRITLVTGMLWGPHYEITLDGNDMGVYAIETSTNLTDWVWVQTWWTENSPAEVWPYSPGLGSYNFYRARLLP